MYEKNAEKRFENEASIRANEEKPDDITAISTLISKKEGDRDCSVYHEEVDSNLASKDAEKSLGANSTVSFIDNSDGEMQKTASVENHINPYFYGTKLEDHDVQNEMARFDMEVTVEAHAKLFLYFINKVKERKRDLLSETTFYHHRDEKIRDIRRFSWIESQQGQSSECVPFARMYSEKMRVQATNRYYRGFCQQQEVPYLKRPEENLGSRYYGEGFRIKSRSEKKAAIIKAKKFIEKEKGGENSLIEDPANLDGRVQEKDRTQ